MLSEECAKFQIGKKLRQLRQELALSAGAVAASTGVGEDALRRYEDSEALPGLEELVRLAAHFDVRVDYFLQVPSVERKVEVVRSEGRWTVQPQTSAAKTLNFRYQALTYRLTDRLLSPYLVEIPPSGKVAVEPSAHSGEEFLFLLSGELVAEVGGESHRLAPGDSLYFSSSHDHSLRAVGARLARLLACVTNMRRPHETGPLERAFGFLE